MRLVFEFCANLPNLARNVILIGLCAFFNNFSYFQFVKVEKPAVYSMKKKEIVDRLGNIITEVMPDNEKWRNQSIKDLVVKYKVCRYHQEICFKSNISYYFCSFWLLSMKEMGIYSIRELASKFSQHGSKYKPLAHPRCKNL